MKKLINPPLKLASPRILGFFLLTILFSPFNMAETIRIGLVDYPPHLNLNSDIKKSKLYQYIESTFTSQGLKVLFTEYTQKRGEVELEKGEIDLLLPFEGKDKQIKVLSRPLFHSTPGLCFKKDNFIPILSASHLFKDLVIGIPAGANILPVLKDSGALLVILEGIDATSRGIDLTQRGRIDAFYHPSPTKIYQQENLKLNKVVCSYFHGYSAGVFIATSPLMDPDMYKLINQIYTNAFMELSYEYYFAKNIEIPIVTNQ